MSYRKDDGSTASGIFMFGCVLLAFVAGYWFRDQGFRFNIDIPHPTEQRRTK